MNTTLTFKRVIAIATSALGFQMAAQAADWSQTDISYQRGYGFVEPLNGTSQASPEYSKERLVIENASGFGQGLGRSYLFVTLASGDSLSSGSNADVNVSGIYSEGYVGLSMSKMTGSKWSAGIIKDVLVTGGYNYGVSNNPLFATRPQVLLLGGSVDLTLPGFQFFTVDMLAYRDLGRYNSKGYNFNAPTSASLCGNADNTYQVTPSWKAPFSIGGSAIEFTGFMDVIGSHGTCAQQVVFEPKLKVDVGNYFGSPNKVFMGVSRAYMGNKYGTDGVNEWTTLGFLQWRL